MKFKKLFQNKFTNSISISLTSKVTNDSYFAGNLIFHNILVYQAISRYNHLLDVYQKALDLQSEERKTDPLKAIIKIQAITRGFLTRKRVNQIRHLTNMDLGLTTESLIKSISENKRTSFLKDLEIEKLIFEKQLPETFCDNINDLENFIKDNFFTVDPLLEEFYEEKQKKIRIDENIENIFSELYVSEALKLQYTISPKAQPTSVQKFDDLVSQPVTVKSKGKTSHIDLKIFLYNVIIFPFSLQEWGVKKIKKSNVLLIGDPGSGKSVWTGSLCEKCFATRIKISRRLFMKKFMRRKKLVEMIAQVSL